MGFVVVVWFVLLEIGVLCVVLAALDLGWPQTQRDPSTASTFQVLGLKASVTIALVSLRCSFSTHSWPLLAKVKSGDFTVTMLKVN